MNASERDEKARQARQRLQARRARAGFLRGRVFAASILCFGVFWAVVFFQMATGNDPVLSTKTPATQTEKRKSPAARNGAAEVVEPREPEELDEEREDGAPRTEASEGPAAEPEPRSVETEVVEAPEPELEPLTTGQS